MIKFKPYFNPEPLWQNGVVIVRVVTALLIGFHGLVVFMPELMIHNARMVEEAKLPFPFFTAYLGKSIEFLGALALLLGFGTRVFSALLASVFFVLTFFIHDGNVLNSETVHPFLYLLLCTMFFVVGPGRVSLDRKIYSN